MFFRISWYSRASVFEPKASLEDVNLAWYADILEE